MKKHVILGSLLALSVIANAQWAGSGTTTGNIYRTGNVGLGTTTPAYPLDVVNTSGTGINVAVSGGSTTDGVLSFVTGSGGAGSIATGVYGQAQTALINTGGFFYAQGTTNTSMICYGVKGVVNVAGTAPNMSTNYAVYGDVQGNGNSSGSGPCYAGYFNGDVVSTTAFFSPSDKRLKTNITKISNSLDIINKLNPISYNFDTKSNPSMTLPSVKQYGFISQEVQEILPELTKTIKHPAQLDGDGKEVYPAKEILGLNYNGFIALLAKAIQEQQAQIEALQNQLNGQSNTNSRTGAATGLDQLSSPASGFALDQNIPNPFSQETVIKYTLPQQVNTAYMLVYDLSGKQVASFPLTDKGSSSITITSDKLAAGMYLYSMMADGKILDSKRMVVAQK